MRGEDIMLELIGGAELWQWDTGRQIDCAGLQAGTKVQFAYSDTQTLSTTVKTADGASVADVPNQLLLRSGALMVYAYVTEADGVSYTKYAARFNVQARPKPDDYVYTPTEVQSWQTIRNEIGDLDDLTTTAKNNLVAAINEAAASGGGGGGSITKDSIVTALGYTPEDAANKTTALSASSTGAQYPSAKAVWDAIPHPEAKTDAMAQAVGKDADGKLWTAPGGRGRCGLCADVGCQSGGGWDHDQHPAKYRYCIPCDLHRVDPRKSHRGHRKRGANHLCTVWREGAV